jgi:coproporphyrinogen III oxidase
LKASSSKQQQQQHRDDFESFLFEWQSELCDKLTRLDGSNENNNHEGFCDDPWEREDGSFGRTRVFSDGDLFEKAACNVSVIRGTLTETRAKTMSSRGRKGINPKGGQKYNACALSLVWHPRSPHVPTFRADIRRFAVEPDSASVGTETNAWYGGGMDLTPYYLDEEDAKHFHGKCRDVCDEYQTRESVEKFGKHSLYRKYKEFCDSYFYIPARLEHRGVGGLFFDDVATRGGEDGDASVAPSDAKAFTKAVALSWLDVWEPIAKQKKHSNNRTRIYMASTTKRSIFGIQPSLRSRSQVWIRRRDSRQIRIDHGVSSPKDKMGLQSYSARRVEGGAVVGSFTRASRLGRLRKDYNKY